MKNEIATGTQGRLTVDKNMGTYLNDIERVAHTQKKHFLLYPINKKRNVAIFAGAACRAGPDSKLIVCEFVCLR